MKNWKIFLLAVTLIAGCKKPYNPQVISSPKSYLIVEGVINTNDISTIKLSRTVNLSSSITTNPVQAELIVECDNGSNYGLNETAEGIYQLSGVVLDNTRKYRLRIKTLSDNKEYLSDYEQAKTTPPIDSIGFNLTDKGVQIYANSHDPNNATRYYRFDYVETWRFHSKYNSQWISDGTAIVPRHEDQQVYFCFANNASSTILLGSSARLTQDVLYQAPITNIEPTSEKIELKYSIIVHQYALTPDAYKFWENLKRNTEQLGSIFDAQPSQINGNIHNVADPTDVVVGFISAGTVSSKRIFITREELPDRYATNYPYDCQLDSTFYSEPHSHANTVLKVIGGLLTPVNAFYGPHSFGPIGFTASDALCVDCTLRGFKQQPDFWK